MERYATFGPYSGTSAFPSNQIDSDTIFKDQALWIVIENVAMTSGEISLDAAPGVSLRDPVSRQRIRPEVRTAIETILRDDADIWAELANH